MIPMGQDLDGRIIKKEIPSTTDKMDWEKEELCGQTDGVEAMKQAIYKILQTERYQYLIYDWNYGIELSDLFGKNISFVIPELKRRIEEALLADNRVETVDSFAFSQKGGELTAKFTVRTKLGNFEAERQVQI